MVRLRAASWVIVLSMAAVGTARAEWFTWEEGRFKVALPEQPKVGQQAIPTPAGNMTLHVFTAEYPHQTGAVVVTYGDYPPQVNVAQKSEEMLDATVNGTIQGMKATLVRSGRITQAGASGREFSWTSAGPQGKLVGQGRVFIVGTRLYQILALGGEKSMDPQVLQNVLKSFEFKPAPATASAAPTPATPKAATPGAMARANTPAPAAPKGAMRKSTATAKARVPWVNHTGVSYEGFWHVDMPTQPRTSKEPGLFGVKDRNIRVSSDGKLVYTLKIQVVPDKVLEEGVEPVLEAARDKLAEETRGKVVGESDAQLAGRDGHAYQLEVTAPKPSAVAARAALCGKRLVVLSVSGDPKLVAGPSTERFFESFKTDR